MNSPRNLLLIGTAAFALTFGTTSATGQELSNNALRDMHLIGYVNEAATFCEGIITFASDKSAGLADFLFKASLDSRTPADLRKSFHDGAMEFLETPFAKDDFAQRAQCVDAALKYPDWLKLVPPKYGQ